MPNLHIGENSETAIITLIFDIRTLFIRQNNDGGMVEGNAKYFTGTDSQVIENNSFSTLRN